VQIAEDVTDALDWIVAHERVRDIFDKAQVNKNGKACVYLVENITRWTTHYVSFRHTIWLKPALALCAAAVMQRDEIIAAQVGTEKNKKVIKKMTETASK
jgi:hypothetical protein